MHSMETKKMIRITNRAQSIFYPGILTPSVDYLECADRIGLLLEEGATILEVAKDGSTRELTAGNIDSTWVKVTTTTLSFATDASAQIVAEVLSGTAQLTYESDNTDIVVSPTGLVTATAEGSGNVKVKTGTTVHGTIAVTVTAATPASFSAEEPAVTKKVGKNK